LRPNMSLVINTNISSLNTQRHLTASKTELTQAMERLSSGKRINSSMDDAAGLTIAHSLETKITSLQQATRNANDAVSLIHLAEGASDEVSQMLIRMRELAIQALNGTYSSEDVENLNAEFVQIRDEIKRIAGNTLFNGIPVIHSDETIDFQVGYEAPDKITAQLIDLGELAVTEIAGSTDYPAYLIGNNGWHIVTGPAPFNNNEPKVAGDYVSVKVNGVTFTQDFDTDGPTSYQALVAQVNDHFGANTIVYGGKAFIGTAHEEYTFTFDTSVITNPATDLVLPGMTSKYFIGNTSLTDENHTVADALGKVDTALSEVEAWRARMGATANRLRFATENLENKIEKQTAANSRILDADYAVESANLARAQILQQGSTAMLAQANASTQNVLDLLK